MTTSSEDVLLQMGGVRYKKGDGTLYVMNERIAWMVENRDKVAVSHKYQDIKMQKISPEGKQKVQLQVVLHDGNSTTFHFVNKNGVSAQIADRDKVKELLQDLLPKFKRKVDKELEEKNRILSEHPHLLQLYKDLVITQVLTSEEFWSSHAKQYTQQLAQKQEIGVSGAFLADIKPQTDGCNGLKYNLTNDIIECIFKAYPAVKRKHSEHVPAKLSESEFWTKFFQSHYFHRDRINTGTKDIFTECGKIDDQALKIAVADGAGDVFLDLQTFEDNTLEEGFGGAVSDKSGVNSGNIVHQSMIKRFNQHSTMVLNTCLQSSAPSTVTNGIAKTDANKNNVDQGSVVVTNGTKEKHKRNHTSITDDTDDISVRKVADPKIKKARILEKIRYDDLEGEDEQTSKGPSQLNLVKIERYLHGPIPVTHNESLDDAHQLESVQYQLLNEINSWSTRTPHKVLVSATAAVNALGELSPGGALMRGFQEQSLAQLVPPGCGEGIEEFIFIVK
ncbi:hypothetical protein HA402_011350 [Bradysia odoriphaga]|nr:hypothetical protein HA402_011350 [Bradysia odoriphaga]